MGSSSSTAGSCLLTGNDGAGKTTLVATACSANNEMATVVSTIGASTSNVRLPGRGGAELTVVDAGAGCRGWGLILGQLKPGMAVLHMIKASDQRLCSSLWELYTLAKSQPESPVIVVVVKDVAAGWETVVARAERSALPPCWSEEQVVPPWADDFASVTAKKRTSSHGCQVDHDDCALDTLHKSSWRVLVIEPGSVECVAQVFSMVYDSLCS